MRSRESSPPRWTPPRRVAVRRGSRALARAPPAPARGRRCSERSPGCALPAGARAPQATCGRCGAPPRSRRDGARGRAPGSGACRQCAVEGFEEVLARVLERGRIDTETAGVFSSRTESTFGTGGGAFSRSFRSSAWRHSSSSSARRSSAPGSPPTSADPALSGIALAARSSGFVTSRSCTASAITWALVPALEMTTSPPCPGPKRWTPSETKSPSSGGGPGLVDPPHAFPADVAHRHRSVPGAVRARRVGKAYLVLAWPRRTSRGKRTSFSPLPWLPWWR